MNDLGQIHLLAGQVADCFARDGQGVLQIAATLADAPEWARDLVGQLLRGEGDHEYLAPVLAACTFIAAHGATDEDASLFAGLHAGSTRPELLAWMGRRSWRERLLDEVLAEPGVEPWTLVGALQEAQRRELVGVYRTAWGFLRDMAALDTVADAEGAALG